MMEARKRLGAAESGYELGDNYSGSKNKRPNHLSVVIGAIVAGVTLLIIITLFFSQSGPNYKIQEAKILLGKGEIQKALAAYNRILTKYPENCEAFYGRAEAQEKLAEETESLQVIVAAAETYEHAAEVADCTPLVKKLAMLKASDLMLSVDFHGTVQRILGTMEEIYPDDPDILARLGQLNLATRDVGLARDYLRRSLHKDKNNALAKCNLGYIMKAFDGKHTQAIQFLQEGLQSNEPGIKTAENYIALGEALQRVNKEQEAMTVFQEGVKQGVIRSVHQRSLVNIEKLKPQPIWNVDEVNMSQHIEKLEENWQVILTEALTVIEKGKDNFLIQRPISRPLIIEKGERWDFILYAEGKKNNIKCQKMPHTCEIVENIPDKTTRGQVKLNVIAPETHVWASCGPTNNRIRMLLGLSTPEGAKMRVGNETRIIKEGKVFLFDDSFEHEFWNESKKPQILLIIDIWHPEVTEVQRNILKPLR